MAFRIEHFYAFLQQRQVYNVSTLVNVNANLNQNTLIPDYVNGSEYLYELFGFDSLNEDFLARCNSVRAFSYCKKYAADEI